MKIRFQMAILVLCVAMVGPVHAQYVGSHVMADGASNTNFFMGRTLVGSSNAPGTDKFYVNGDATIEGAVKVPKQGDVSMGPYTNGVSAAGLTSSNLAIQGHWISSDGDNEGIYVSSDGLVGVGTSSPSSQFTVAGTVEAQSGGFKFPNGSVQSSAVSIAVSVGTLSFVNTGFSLQPSDSVIFSNVGTTAVTFYATGSPFTNAFVVPGVSTNSSVNTGFSLYAGTNLTFYRASPVTNSVTNLYVDLKPTFAFTANRSGTNQALANSTWTKIYFSNEVFDVGSWYTPANSRVTIAQDGKYQLTVTVSTTGTGSGDNTWLGIYRNSNLTYSVGLPKGGNDIAPVRSATLITPVLNVTNGEYYEVYVYRASGSSAEVDGTTTYTWWSGWQVK